MKLKKFFTAKTLYNSQFIWHRTKPEHKFSTGNVEVIDSPWEYCYNSQDKRVAGNKSAKMEIAGAAKTRALP